MSMDSPNVPSLNDGAGTLIVGDVAEKRHAAIPAAIVERARYDQTIRLCIAHYMRGDITLENCLASAAVTLSRALETSRAELLRHVSRCRCRHAAPVKPRSGELDK